MGGNLRTVGQFGGRIEFCLIFFSKKGVECVGWLMRSSVIEMTRKGGYFVSSGSHSTDRGSGSTYTPSHLFISSGWVLLLGRRAGKSPGFPGGQATRAWSSRDQIPRNCKKDYLRRAPRAEISQSTFLATDGRWKYSPWKTKTCL